MRLLIAAGGTGGHIYPALAVARSLRARRTRLSSAGSAAIAGSRRSSCRPPGIPLAGWPLRSLRSVDRDVHLVLDPLRLGASVPQAGACSRAWRPTAVFTTGGYVAIPVLIAAAPLRHPACCGRAT